MRHPGISGRVCGNATHNQGSRRPNPPGVPSPSTGNLGRKGGTGTWACPWAPATARRPAKSRVSMASGALATAAARAAAAHPTWAAVTKRRTASRPRERGTRTCRPARLLRAAAMMAMATVRACVCCAHLLGLRAVPISQSARTLLRLAPTAALYQLHHTRHASVLHVAPAHVFVNAHCYRWRQRRRRRRG